MKIVSRPALPFPLNVRARAKHFQKQPAYGWLGSVFPATPGQGSRLWQMRRRQEHHSLVRVHYTEKAWPLYLRSNAETRK
jgi:hypothetical protein